MARRDAQKPRLRQLEQAVDQRRDRRVLERSAYGVRLARTRKLSLAVTHQIGDDDAHVVGNAQVGDETGDLVGVLCKPVAYHERAWRIVRPLLQKMDRPARRLERDTRAGKPGPSNRFADRGLHHLLPYCGAEPSNRHVSSGR